MIHYGLLQHIVLSRNEILLLANPEGCSDFGSSYAARQNEFRKWYTNPFLMWIIL
ncbi:hypothetical protein Lalb_Chr03g0037741 [Lupinus albus]|uniref:Uncharacterized protein n=1 Tax=Lupinus albus TaxID=3870 RepID=A0A6A4QXK3_LUPAL|nr:hypothetical protein Lalb_Chr03g0037741 [Lupinus albus]